MTTLLLFMTPPSQSGGGESGFVSTLVMFALIIGIFYFLILRPQQKRQKDRQKLLDAIKKGDKIITSGGLHGTVAGVDDKTLLVQVADNVKLKFDRAAVSMIVKEGEPEQKEQKK